MDFQEGSRHYTILCEKRARGELDDAAFAAAVAAIRVTDASGYTWTLDTGGRWLYWNGSAWVAPPGGPPAAGAGAPRPEAAPAKAAGAAGGTVPASGAGQELEAGLRRVLRWFPMILGTLRGRLPPTSVFLQQMRHVPLRKRPQPWWDMLAILGGAAAGTLWFLYSSVRGLPHFIPLQREFESSADFIPPLLLGVGAFLLWTFRRRVAGALQPLLAPLRKVPLLGRFAMGGGVLVIGWLIRTRSGLFQDREGMDLITPLLMVALPVLIVVFREPLDAILRPLDPYRRRIPRIVLVVLGLAAPYFVAHILYRWFGLIQYPFLRASVVFGTMISYAILRTPAGVPPRGRGRAPAGRGRAAPARGATPPPLPGNAGSALSRRTAWAGLAWMVGIHLLMVTPALADDFLRDPFNANDGLRTPGVAEAIAGTVTVIVSGLVNGAEVVRTVIEVREESGAAGGEGAGGAVGTPAGAGGEGGEEQEPRQVQIVVNTTDASGSPGTRLETGVNDAVFIYAYAVEVGKGGLDGVTGSLGFHLESGPPFVFLTDHGMTGGQRCAGVQFESPLPDGPAPSSVVVRVSAVVEGKTISVPVTLELVVAPYVVRFR